LIAPAGRLWQPSSFLLYYRRFPAALLGLVAVLFFFPGARSALAIEPLDIDDEAAPSFDVYTSEDGLSTEIWSAVGVDARGFVWAGSASSLARFDGYRWQLWPVAGASSLVRDFTLDSQGRFWALFEGDGIALLGDDDQWRVVQDLPGIRHFYEHKTAEGERQTWLVYADGLARLVDGRWVPDPANGPHTADAIGLTWTSELEGRALQWLARYNQGGLWHREVLAGQRYGPWERVPLPQVQTMALNSLQRSYSGEREELWLISYTTGLARLDSDGLEVWRAFDSCSAVHYPGPQPAPPSDGDCRPAALPTEAMYSAEVTYEPDGTRSLWLSTRAGLVRIRGERFLVYGRENGLPSDAVRGLAQQRVDDADVLWAATEGGLARAAIADIPWRTVSLLGARENGTFGVMLEPDGQGGERLWVGSSQRGLAMFEQGSWRYFNAAAGNLPTNEVRAIWRVRGPDGEPWRLIAFTDGGLYRITDRFEFERLDGPPEQQAGAFVDDVLVRDGAEGHELWLATFGDGVYRRLDGEWTHYSLKDTQAHWRALDLLEQVDEQGRSWLWVAGFGGLGRFDGERWQAVDLEGMRDIDSGYVHLVERQGRQELWVATYRQGVIRLDVSNPQVPQVLTGDDVPPSADPTVYSILSDSRGNIYVCTNNGVQRLRPQADGGYTSRVFRRADGLVHDECNSNSQLIDRLDRYWVGTLGGLSLFDPNMRSDVEPGQSSSAPGKPLLVTAMALDGNESLAPDGPIIVPAGVREVRIDFALLSGLHEDESRYRSQLIGYESEPVGWTTSRRRHFANLAPGEYVLRIEAVDYAGVAASPLSIDLDVAPHWWQRRGTQALFVVAAVLLLVGSVMRYNRGLRERQHELTRLVEERTAELSAANERLTRLSYGDPLTGLANRRRLMKSFKQELFRARKMNQAIGLIIADVDLFKPYNDTHGHVAGDVALSAVAQALATATRKRDMVARLGGEEFACLIVDTDLETVKTIAERMRELVARLTPRELGNETDRLTISAGVLVRVPREDDDLSSMLTDCDAALYRAKHAGRNRVCVAGSWTATRQTVRLSSIHSSTTCSSSVSGRAPWPRI